MSSLLNPSLLTSMEDLSRVRIRCLGLPNTMLGTPGDGRKKVDREGSGYEPKRIPTPRSNDTATAWSDVEPVFAESQR